MRVVSDTSPISNLLLIGQLDLLRLLFEVVIVPPAVDFEIRRLSIIGEDISAYEQSSWIVVRRPSSPVLVSQLRDSLDEGESEAIVLAKELGCDFLLIDERRGTQIARSNGLATIGLLGVLFQAKSKEMIAKVKPLLDDLEQTAGFWLGQKLRTSFLKDHGE